MKCATIFFTVHRIRTSDGHSLIPSLFRNCFRGNHSHFSKSVVGASNQVTWDYDAPLHRAMRSDGVEHSQIMGK